MKRNERARKNKESEMGNEKEEWRDGDENCEPICAVLDRVSDEVYAIIKERGSIKGRML